MVTSRRSSPATTATGPGGGGGVGVGGDADTSNGDDGGEGYVGDDVDAEMEDLL